MAVALKEIEAEMEERVKFFKSEDKLIEAQRIEQRTRYDIEMLSEIGMCKGIENYSRVLSGRKPGSQPCTLLDYFPDDFLLSIRRCSSAPRRATWSWKNPRRSWSRLFVRLDF